MKLPNIFFRYHHLNDVTIKIYNLLFCKTSNSPKKEIQLKNSSTTEVTIDDNINNDKNTDTNNNGKDVKKKRNPISELLGNIDFTNVD